MTKLLIAEDDQNIRQALRQIIPWQQNDIQLCADATNGRQVLETVERDRPDILLLDIQMPFMDGIQVARRLHEKQFEGEIIILSGHDEFAYAQAAVKYGVFEYLLKPCRPGDILECVLACRRRILERRRQNTLVRSMEQPYYVETEQRFRARLLAGSPNDVFVPPDEPQRELLEAIRTGSPEQAGQFVWEIFRLISGGLYGRQHIINYLFSVFQAVVDLREEYEPLAEEALRCRDYRYISQYLTLREVQEQLRSLACSTAELRREQFRASPAIRETLLYLKTHYSEEIELKTLSSAVHITPTYLSVAFKKQVGMNYLEYLNRYRVSRAGEALAMTKKKIYQVARENGFKDEKYFSNVFKKFTGLSPSEYRANHYKTGRA